MIEFAWNVIPLRKGWAEPTIPGLSSNVLYAATMEQGRIIAFKETFATLAIMI